MPKQPEPNDDATPITGTYGAQRVRNRELQGIRSSLDKVAYALSVLQVVVAGGVFAYVLHWVITGR